MKPGDRVRVYDVCQVMHWPTDDKGTVVSIRKEGALLVEMDTWGSPPHNKYYFHPKQCRKLIKVKS